jgi:signal transduction histidine kinase
MTTVAAIKFLTFLESVLLGLLANREEPASKSNGAFVRYMLLVAASSLVEFMLVISPNARMFLFWKQFDFFMFYAVAALFQFSLMLRGYAWASTRRFNLALYGAVSLIALLEGFVMRPQQAVAGTWSFSAEYPQHLRDIHSVFVVGGSLMALATVVVLRACLVHAKDRRSRIQSGIFFWSSLVLMMVGTSVELIAAFQPGIELPLSVTATSAYLVVNPVLAFAVVRYGLLQLWPVSALSAIMDMMSESVILADQHGTIRYMNTAASVLTGRPQTEVSRRLLESCGLRNGSPGATALGYADLRNGGLGLRYHECLLEGAGKDPIPISLSSTVLKTRLWGETGIIITFRNISERRKMEELRDGAERIMRHDLRNTLTGIYALSTSLVADRSLGTEQKDRAVMIHDGALLLNEQIDSYLYLRSVEDGAFKAPLESVDLAEVLRSVERNLGPLAESMNVHLAFLVDGKPADASVVLDVRGIRSMLFGIFVNLVKNAIEASPFGSEVGIQVKTSGPVVISVRNRGAIPEEIRPRFFTKFATAGKRRGTGIGAYGARIMAEALGCTVAFTSSEEQGTEVVVTFPLPTAAVE